MEGELLLPSPIRVKARTWISYRTYLPRPLSWTLWLVFPSTGQKSGAVSESFSLYTTWNAHLVIILSSLSEGWYRLWIDCWPLTLYPRMSPLRSASGTSPHRTRMLLEVVAKADTLVGPLEGTTVRGGRGGLAHSKLKHVSEQVRVWFVNEACVCPHRTLWSCHGPAGSRARSRYRWWPELWPRTRSTPPGPRWWTPSPAGPRWRETGLPLWTRLWSTAPGSRQDLDSRCTPTLEEAERIFCCCCCFYSPSSRKININDIITERIVKQ